MTILKLIAGTTRPTEGAVDDDLTGCTVQLRIGYDTGTVTKSCTLGTCSAGYSQFSIAWADGDLVPGRWAAQFVITDAAGKIEIGEEFAIYVEGRI